MTNHAPSVTTFMLGAALPWPEDPTVSQEAGPLDEATVHGQRLSKRVAIRKISALGATLRGTATGESGDRVTIELVTGQRAPGTIAWADSGELGVNFDLPVDVVALINRKLVSQPADRRTMPRVELRCSAWVKEGKEFAPALIRNISARGLQLEVEELPSVGAKVSVFIDGLDLPTAEVIWTKGNLAGVELASELSWASILPWIRQIAPREPQ